MHVCIYLSSSVFGVSSTASLVLRFRRRSGRRRPRPRSVDTTQKAQGHAVCLVLSINCSNS